MSKWSHRFYWKIFFVPWGDTRFYQFPDALSNWSELTCTSLEIKNVNSLDQQLGRPVMISLYDSEDKQPPVNVLIPPYCKPVYFRFFIGHEDLAHRTVKHRAKNHFIGYTDGCNRNMIAVDDSTGVVYGGIINYMDNQ